MIKLLLALWQLPQVVLGLLIIFFSRAKKVDGIEGSDVYQAKDAKGWGISLGPIIVFGEYGIQPNSIKHEYGHSVQSLIFGPLYLLVIGLPSIIMNLMSRPGGLLKVENYYKRFPENWADKLGEVKRA